MLYDTIAAIATPPGAGGIAVVRISGPQALAVAARVFRPANPGKRIEDAPGYTALFGHFYMDGRRCDETVALIFRAPKSYTGEDVVELSCHGGTAVVARLLDACLAAGARMAAGGEFTRRAFENGRMTLPQAEAVMDLVNAENRQAAAAAESALAGSLWAEAQAMADALLGLGAHIAAWCDYPEEDVPAIDEAALTGMLTGLRDRLAELCQNYDKGAAIRRGVPAVLVGTPNVGKSTLLNLLLGRQRAIVTPIAGTTRDVLEETVVLDGVTLHIADTAGVRDTQDPVEREGVRRTHAALAAAALALAVFDTARPLTQEDTALAQQLLADAAAGRPVLFILNKTDCPAAWQPQQLLGQAAAGDNVLPLCAASPAARAPLEAAILRLLQLEHFDPDAPLLANRRQLAAAQNAHAAVAAALDALANGLALDAVGVCVQDALDGLYALMGQNAADTVIDEVFSRFCVGK